MRNKLILRKLHSNKACKYFKRRLLSGQEISCENCYYFSCIDNDRFCRLNISNKQDQLLKKIA